MDGVCVSLSFFPSSTKCRIVNNSYLGSPDTEGACWDTGLATETQRIIIIFGSQSGYVSGHTDGFLTPIFLCCFPSHWPIGKVFSNAEYKECTAVTLRRKLSREGKGGCCDCWHLWPPFICVRGGLASLWLRLPWRGSGGGLPGPQPESQSDPELLPNVTGRGREFRCAAAAQITGMADLPWLVTWLCTYPWVWRLCVQMPVDAVCSERIVMVYVLPPFSVISCTRCDLMKRV